MAALLCSGCGSPLTLPTDLLAQDVTCAFCPARTILPPELLQVRLLERQEAAAEAEKKAELAQQAQAQEMAGKVVKRTTSMVLWIVVISTLVPIVLTVAGFFFAARMTSHMTSHATHGH
jgi:LSD1 subclass zinc finger protein